MRGVGEFEPERRPREKGAEEPDSSGAASWLKEASAAARPAGRTLFDAGMVELLIEEVEVAAPPSVLPLDATLPLSASAPLEGIEIPVSRIPSWFPEVSFLRVEFEEDP